MQRRVFRGFHTSGIRFAETTTTAAATTGTETTTKVNLNLSSPSESFYQNTPVELVVVPGLVGEYGITAGHTPLISQLKPGVIEVHHEREKNVEKFFTAGGFAFTHENSTTDLACVELVKLEDIDIVIAQNGIETEKNKMEAAPEGSMEKVEAQIALEAYQAMTKAAALASTSTTST